MVYLSCLHIMEESIFFFAYLIKAVEMQNFCFERGFPSFSSLGMFLLQVIFEGFLQSFNSSTSASVRMYH